MCSDILVIPAGLGYYTSYVAVNSSTHWTNQLLVFNWRGSIVRPFFMHFVFSTLICPNPSANLLAFFLNPSYPWSTCCFHSASQTQSIETANSINSSAIVSHVCGDLLYVNCWMCSCFALQLMRWCEGSSLIFWVGRAKRKPSNFCFYFTLLLCRQNILLSVNRDVVGVCCFMLDLLAIWLQNAV